MTGSNENKYFELENDDILFKHEFNPEVFKSNKNFNFSVTLNNESQIIFNKILQKSIEVQSLLDVCSVIKEYQIGKGTPKQTQSDKEKRIFNSNLKIDDTYVKELRGKNIDKYFIKWNNEYVKYGKHIAEPRDVKYFQGERILIRKIPGLKSLVVAYIKDDYVIDQSLYIGKPLNEFVSIKHVLGCLNSTLVYWYFKNLYNEFDTLFPQIKTNEFKSLPILNCSESEKQPFTDLVNQILSKKEKGEDTTEIEAQIDQLVYKLYELTEEEIKIVENA